MNRLFARNGAAYEITNSGNVIRLGTPLVTDVVIGAVLDTGDDELDTLLDRARAKYLSTDATVRRESLGAALGCLGADEDAAQLR